MITVDITIKDKNWLKEIENIADFLQKTINNLAQHTNLNQFIKNNIEIELSILLTDDQEIQSLNKDYRGKNKATNTLSFPLIEKNESLEGAIIDDFLAIGDIIYLETGDSAKFKNIKSSLSGLVIGESGIPKKTIGLLGDLKSKALASIKAVQEYDSDFNLHSAVLKDVDKYSDILSEELQTFFYSSIKNHMITQNALIALNEDILNYETIGALMNEHHSVLKNILKITTPKIDNMIEAALEAGAFGAKIVGSGGGGSICAISSKQNKQRVIDNILTAGAKDAYAVSVTSGKQFIVS